MSTTLRESLSGRGPVAKILLTGAALSAVGLIGAGVAGAAGASTTAGHPVTARTSHSVVVKTTTPKTTEPTGGTDTDTINVQSGDQTSPDKPGATEAKDSTEPTSGADTDNVQSGDQTGVDKPAATESKDSAEPTSGADTDNVQSQSGDQSGPDTGQ